jgi:hypothetical protein
MLINYDNYFHRLQTLGSITLSTIEEINNAMKDSIIKRITFLGTKGDIGRPTLAFMLSKALASRGKNVMFIEGGLTNTISSTIGIKGDGFITNIVNDKDPYDSLLKIPFGSGSITVLKLFGNREVLKEIERISKEPDLKEKFRIKYSEILREGYDIYLFDLYASYIDSKEFTELESAVFRSSVGSYDEIRIYISTISRTNIESTPDLYRKIENSPERRGIPLAMIFNMMPDASETYVRREAERIQSLGIPIILIISLREDLLAFSDDPVKMPIIDEIEFLAEIILSGQISAYGVVSSKDLLEEALKVGAFTIIQGFYDRHKTDKIISLVKKASSRGRDIVLVSTREDLAYLLKRTGIKPLEIRVSRRFMKEMQEASKLDDVLRLAHSLSNDIIFEIQSLTRPLLIIYYAEDLAPHPKIPYKILRDEFWNAVINSLRFKHDLSILLVCKDSEDCAGAEKYADHRII